METIPRDATPTWARPKYAPLPRDDAPRFTSVPLPLMLPDFPSEFIDSFILEPLVWHTGIADETLLEYVWDINDFPYLAVVAGSWPEETIFDWVINDGGTQLIHRTLREALAIVPDSNTLTYGVFSASVTVTAPGYYSQTLGPITLTVTSNGC